MKALVTGGTVYIGSHTCVELIQRGADVLIVDNLCNSSPKVLDRIEQITGMRPAFLQADIRDDEAMSAAFADFAPDVVLHFAALKAVGESTAKPLEYFDNNVGGSLALFRQMQAAGVRKLVYSSSATVYGDPSHCPIAETAPRSAHNPYGRSKLVTEDLIADLSLPGGPLQAAVLRYFNPVGAHPSGRIGEDPRGIPNNLMPFVTRVAVGRSTKLQVFGADYPTVDGTGVRDYIHVQDLARAHVDAIDFLDRTGSNLTVNLGTGRGHSVLEVVTAFEAASGRTIAWEIAPRRAGDVAQCYADPSLAHAMLGWRAEFDLARMCEDAWRWQRGNPDGYA
ncbi:UDP-glucose 4-epimerase GalE [soil metagenome]